MAECVVGRLVQLGDGGKVDSAYDVTDKELVIGRCVRGCRMGFPPGDDGIRIPRTLSPYPIARCLPNIDDGRATKK